MYFCGYLKEMVVNCVTNLGTPVEFISQLGDMGES